MKEEALSAEVVTKEGEGKVKVSVTIPEQVIPAKTEERIIDVKFLLSFRESLVDRVYSEVGGTLHQIKEIDVDLQIAKDAGDIIASKIDLSILSFN